jgi:hypothetical protein
VSVQIDNVHDSTARNELLWFAGAVGTTVGLAVWAYSRREPSYWERTKRAVDQVAETAGEMNPWLGIGTVTAALGCAALRHRMRAPKSTLQRASERADQIVSQTSKQLRPWLGVISGAAISAASAAYNAKSRRRATNSVADRAASAAYRFVDAGSRIWRRVQPISVENGKFYSRVRRLIA